MPKLAVECGISSFSINPGEWRLSSGESTRMVVLEVATSTPKRIGFIAVVLHSPRYNSKNYTINVKAPALNYQQRGP
jgi:hypothetical protein